MYSLQLYSEKSQQKFGEEKTREASRSSATRALRWEMLYEVRAEKTPGAPDPLPPLLYHPQDEQVGVGWVEPLATLGQRL